MIPLERVEDRVEAVVLGAGITGLVTASVLLRQGLRSVVLVDSYAQVGGNHLDVMIGDYTFDVGSFIFQDDSPLLEHFPELLERYIVIDPSWSRLNPQGRVTAYPFSVRDDLVSAGPGDIARIALSALAARLDRRPIRNARDFARRCVGSYFLRRSGLESYMTRFCGCPIAEIDLTFARSRMMWIHEHTRLRAIWARVRASLTRSEPAARSNRQLARPPQGFTHLYAPVAERLQQQGVELKLSTTVLGISRRPEGMRVETSGGSFLTERVVSTIPLDLVAGPVGIAVEPLPNVTLVSLFYSFAGLRGFDSSILYNFSHEASWKRLTVYSDFYGAVHGREFFAVEVVAGREGAMPSDADVEFRAHCTKNGLFDGDLILEGDHVLPHAYPIYTGGSADRAAALAHQLAELGIESFGRQGGFRYQATARASTQEAEAALNTTGGPPSAPAPRRRVQSPRGDHGVR